MDYSMHSSADAERSIGTSSSSGSSSLSPPPSSALLPKDWHWHAGEQAMLETFVKSFEGKAVNWSAVAAAIAATFPAQGMDAVRSAEECEQKWINVLAERSLAGPRQVRPTPPKIILHNHANVPPTRGPNWRPDQINQLISAVTGRTSGPYISDVEWTEIGLSLTPTRTWQSCKRKWNMVQQEDYRRQSAVLVVQDQAASGKAQSPTIGDDPAPSPVSTTPSYTGRRLKPYAGPPSAQDGNGNALVSVGEQPFSPEEDFIMLEMLSRRPAVSYKYIAFSLNPPRYKAEVRRRLRDLVSVREQAAASQTPPVPIEHPVVNPAIVNEAVAVPPPLGASLNVGAGESLGGIHSYGFAPAASLAPSSQPFPTLPSNPPLDELHNSVHLSKLTPSSIMRIKLSIPARTLPRPTADGSFESAAEGLRRLALPTQRLW